jgi:hypothetical protein
MQRVKALRLTHNNNNNNKKKRETINLKQAIKNRERREEEEEDAIEGIRWFRLRSSRGCLASLTL